MNFPMRWAGGFWLVFALLAAPWPVGAQPSPTSAEADSVDRKAAREARAAMREAQDEAVRQGIREMVQSEAFWTGVLGLPPAHPNAQAMATGMGSVFADEEVIGWGVSEMEKDDVSNMAPEFVFRVFRGLLRLEDVERESLFQAVFAAMTRLESAHCPAVSEQTHVALLTHIRMTADEWGTVFEIVRRALRADLQRVEAQPVPSLAEVEEALPKIHAHPEYSALPDQDRNVCGAAASWLRSHADLSAQDRSVLLRIFLIKMTRSLKPAAPATQP